MRRPDGDIAIGGATRAAATSSPPRPIATRRPLG